MPMSSQGKAFDANDTETGSDRKILLFDLDFTGHHAGYIQNLIRYWRDEKLPGKLYVVVTPKFVQLHTDVVKIAADNPKNNIIFVTISPEEEAAIKAKNSGINRTIRSFQEWNLLCKYASKLEVNHCLLMYFDSFQLPLSLGGKPPCALSGIYFRPVFHYSSFEGFRPSWRERSWQIRDKFFLSRILGNSYFYNLFCLDPFVVAHISKKHRELRVMHLADPVKIYDYPDSEIDAIKKDLGIQNNRKIFLIFGAPRKRKGIYELLDAISLLPSDLCEKFCLLLVGPVASEELVETRIEEISKSLPVQFVKYDKFIPDEQIQPYFQIADFILAPYQRHIGMSAILVRAAGAQKPVLSSNYGLMGEMVKRYKLGIAVDSTVPSEITKGLTQMLLEPSTKFGDISKMKYFAEQNSPSEFGRIIFQHI